MIEQFYGNRKAKRSGVKLMNHINEGTNLLRAIGATDEAIEAYRLHPMFQEDKYLDSNFHKLVDLDPKVIIYIIEYRNIANSSLSDIVYKDLSSEVRPLRLKRPIKISPIEEVNKMLLADKIQNWKDFKLYHLGKHERSDELDFYFCSWIRALDVSDAEARYMEGLLK